MPTPFYIHTLRSTLASGLVRGAENLSVPGDLEYSLTDIIDIELFATRGAPDGLEPWSGDDNRLVEVAIGECGRPDSGTWTLEGGGSNLNLTEITLDANATPQQVKDEIVANSSATESDVVVTGIPGFYRIEFVDALADTEIDALSADGANLSPRSIAGVFRKKDGGGGENAVQIVSLSLATLGYSADFSQNALEDGWVGKLRFDGVALVEAVKESGDESIVTNLVIRITDDNGRPFTYVRRGIRIWCQVIPIEAISDTPLTAQMLEELLTSGTTNANFATLVINDPGLKTQSSVVALIDDGELVVPTPNTGNTLLIERDGGVGTTTISSVSGLVPGAIYLLKNMDGGTLALAGDLNDSDSVDLPDGKTCWLYADTETTGHIIGWHLEETA